MVTRFASAIVRYYAALRISAGAATLVLPFHPQRYVAPIVRTTDQQGCEPFDRRELIVRSGRSYVITVAAAPGGQDQQPICPN